MDNPRVTEAVACRACERRQVFGVAMRRTPTGYRCPECGHTEPTYPRSFPRSIDPFAERDEREEIHACYAEDTSRRGRCVPEDAGGGGDACGKAKAAVNPFKWMRRGA